jgi:hypothetical protein
MDVDQLSSIIAVPPSAEPIVCALNGHNFKCKFVHPGFELMFSMTFHKAQGLTMDAVIADLGKPLGGSVPRPSIFVAFSRVRTSQSLRRLGDVGLKFDSGNMKWSKNLIAFLSAMSFSIDQRPVDHLATGIRLADIPAGGEPFAKRRGRPKGTAKVTAPLASAKQPPPLAQAKSTTLTAPKKAPPPRRTTKTSGAKPVASKEHMLGGEIELFNPFDQGRCCSTTPSRSPNYVFHFTMETDSTPGTAPKKTPSGAREQNIIHPGGDLQTNWREKMMIN